MYWKIFQHNVLVIVTHTRVLVDTEEVSNSCSCQRDFSYVLTLPRKISDYQTSKRMSCSPSLFLREREQYSAFTKIETLFDSAAAHPSAIRKILFASSCLHKDKGGFFDDVDTTELKPNIHSNEVRNECICH